MTFNNLNNNNKFDYFEFSLQGDVLKTRNDFRNFYFTFVSFILLLNICVFNISFQVNLFLICISFFVYISIILINYILKNNYLFKYMHIIENIISFTVLLSVLVYFSLYLTYFNYIDLSLISKLNLNFVYFLDKVGCTFIINFYKSYLTIINEWMAANQFNNIEYISGVEYMYSYFVKSVGITFNSVLFFFVFLFFVLNSFGIILSRNPINSLLFLISVYVYSSMLLLVYSLELFALLYVIIYVGAIAVLFLFVIMMLKFEKIPEYKLQKQNLNNLLYLFLLFFLTIFFFKSYNSNMIEAWVLQNSSNVIDESLNNYFNLKPILNDLEDLGLVFYTKYSYIFILCGIILLVSIVAPILLTFKERAGVKKQYHSNQINTEKEKIISLKDIK
jgi:NADH:ubiquinone oxidoreductase subunit 6 (subunit J)